MNSELRRIHIYRLISLVAIILAVFYAGFFYASIVGRNIEQMDLVFLSIGTGIIIIFSLLEMFLLIKGWNKPLLMENIAFIRNGTMTTGPFIVVNIGLVLGITLFSLGLVIFLTNEKVLVKCAMLFASVVGGYLLINCLLYDLFVWMFRKRKFNIKDLL